MKPVLKCVVRKILGGSAALVKKKQKKKKKKKPLKWQLIPAPTRREGEVGGYQQH